MKRILLIFAAFTVLGIFSSSCQLTKPLCPAYSQVEVETEVEAKIGSELETAIVEP